jgi:hypothetical protein
VSREPLRTVATSSSTKIGIVSRRGRRYGCNPLLLACSGLVAAATYAPGGHRPVFCMVPSKRTASGVMGDMAARTSEALDRMHALPETFFLSPRED